MSTLDLNAVAQAIRARALATVVAVTDTVDLGSDAGGITRLDAGSFIDDGFDLGMEVIVSGFPPADNGPAIVTAIGDQRMDVSPFSVAAGKVTFRPTSVNASAPGRSVLATIPSLRTFDDLNLVGVTGVPYFEEEFVPATSTLKTSPARSGQVIDDGVMIYKWWGLPRVGNGALYTSVTALKRMFAQGTILQAGAYAVDIGRFTGAQYGQIVRLTSWSVLTLTIPWSVQSRNTILA